MPPSLVYFFSQRGVVGDLFGAGGDDASIIRGWDPVGVFDLFVPRPPQPTWVIGRFQTFDRHVPHSDRGFTPCANAWFLANWLSGSACPQ